MNRHWGEALLFLCFIIVAAALWYGHAMTSVRTEVIPVSVVYTGIDPHIAFDDTLPSTLSVEVRDMGQRLKTYFKDQPTIIINLHSQIEEDRGEIEITEEQLRSSINSVLQGTSKLLTLTPVALSGTYYKQVDKEVPLILRSRITPAEEYQFAVEPTLGQTTIRIFGSPQMLQKVDTVYTQLYTQEGLKDSLFDWVALDLPKDIRSEEEDVPFFAITERFTEKVFTLPIVCLTPDSTMALRLFPSEVSVTVRCAIRDFNQVEASDIQVSCDFPSSPQERLVVTGTTTNEKITMLRVNPNQVEYLVEQK